MGKAPRILPVETLSTLRGILTKLDKKFQVTQENEWADLVNYSNNVDEPIQRWFRNREGYSSELVQRIIAELPENSLIVDPFCGTGTTSLVASSKGIHSLGVDVNPLAIFIAKVKTRNYSENDKFIFVNALSELTSSITPKLKAANKPGLQIIDKVFMPDILDALLILKFYIYEHFARKTKDFFFLAWLAILEEVSNVYKEGNGIKYRNRKRTSKGYKTIPMEEWAELHFPKNRFQFVIDTFTNQIREMLNDIEFGKPKRYEPRFFEGDALDLTEYVSPESTSLVVFSPPYANNFNYFKAYKVELWMGDFVKSYEEMRSITQRSLRSHVETSLTRNSDKSNWYPEQLDELLDLIDPDHLWTERIPTAIRGYFYDMHTTLEKIFSILKVGGKCVIVVGNSAYGGVLIPTDAMLAEIASAIGFDVEKIAVARHLTTSSQQKKALEPVADYLRESLLVLRKSKKDSWTIKTENGLERLRYVAEIPAFPKEAPHTVYVIRNTGLTDLTHKIHKFPGKFIPHIPRWAIDKFQMNGTELNILDPFCGSGTTLVEARLQGHNAFGIDINPLAQLISKVKTTPLEFKTLDKASSKLFGLIDGKKISPYVPKLMTLDHWFTKSAIKELGLIRGAIEEFKPEKDIYDFFIVSMSSIIRKASNADNQSIKTYVSGTHEKEIPLTIPLFKTTLKNYIERIKQFSEIVPPGNTRILDMLDARDFGSQWIKLGLPKIDLAITSPPYVKTVDYVYSQMAELFWIGDLFHLEDQEKQNYHKRDYIGSEQVYLDQYNKLFELGIEEIDSIIINTFKKNRQHAYIIYKYFKDMIDHFNSMATILQQEAPYIVVIGDSSISGQAIDTHRLISICAERCGFRKQHTFAYEIRNRYMRFPRKGKGGIVDWDWVMTFINK